MIHLQEEWDTVILGEPAWQVIPGNFYVFPTYRYMRYTLLVYCSCIATRHYF